MRPPRRGRGALPRQQRGIDPGAARLAQCRAAGDDRGTAAGIAPDRVIAGTRRLRRASARSREHQDDRGGGFYARSLNTSSRRKPGPITTALRVEFAGATAPRNNLALWLWV